VQFGFGTNGTDIPDAVEDSHRSNARKYQENLSKRLKSKSMTIILHLLRQAENLAFELITYELHPPPINSTFENCPRAISNLSLLILFQANGSRSILHHHTTPWTYP